MNFEVGGMCYNTQQPVSTNSNSSTMPITQNNINIIQGSNGNILLDNISSDLNNMDYNSNNNEDGFDKAFNNLMNAYNKMNPTERPSKVRKLMQDRGSEVQEMFQFGEMDNCMTNTTAPPSITCGSTHLDVCTCSTCPARKELEQLNNFYMEFLQQEEFQL